ncbi:unnamed protein product [Cylicostephanus goldi]|uniref:Replication protein A OB domain-containing protein n=1 Tax=Cylicostephanus goldi TaxID=71465 RepID=A0A3P7LXF6_CYLGO|nr:unnamed protein product [Cylicostephanus goldi]
MEPGSCGAAGPPADYVFGSGVKALPAFGTQVFYDSANSSASKRAEVDDANYVHGEHEKILDLFQRKRHSYGSVGLSESSIRHALSVTNVELLHEDLQYLVRNGHLCRTIDDEHYALIIVCLDMATFAVKSESNWEHGVNEDLKLSTGFFQRFFECDGIMTEVPVLQLTKKITERSVGYSESCFRMRLSDGAFYYSGVFVVKRLEEQCARDKFAGNGGEIIAVTKLQIKRGCWIGKKSDGNPGQVIPMLVISGYELLSRGHPILSKGVSHDGNKDVFANYSPLQVYSVPWKKSCDTNSYRDLLRQDAPVRRIPVASADVKITPISLITPYVNKWRICGLCTSKDELKTIRSPRGGDLLVFSFVITDKDGIAIRISSFNDAAKNAFAKVQLGYSYYISNCLVKQANKRFNTTGHDYELSVNANTEPPLVLKICPLANVPGHKDEFIDVLAVVDQIDPVNKFISRQGRECVKRDLNLVDQSVVVVQLTLWGDQAEHFEDDVLGQVISIKGALVKEWNGTFSLALSSASKVEFNPQFDGVQTLLDWYITKRRAENVKSISMGAIGGSNIFGL